MWTRRICRMVLVYNTGVIFGDPPQFFAGAKKITVSLAGRVKSCFSHAGLTALFSVVFARLLQLHKNRATIMLGRVPAALVGRPFVKRFTLCYWSVVCLSCLSLCNVGVLWPNGWMDRDETWHVGRPRPGHIVLDLSLIHI